MSHPTETPADSSSSTSGDRRERCRRGRRGRRAGRLLFFAALFGLVGAFALPRALAGGWGGGWGHGCHREAAFTAEEVRDHLGMGADHLLDRVEASDAQRAQVEDILDEAAPVAVAFHAEGRELRQAARASLKDGQVDRAALEELRQDALDLADRASAAALDHLVRVAEVLTPEQRKELAGEFAQRHGED